MLLCWALGIIMGGVIMMCLLWILPNNLCPNGKKHQWGNWESAAGAVNTHKCVNCGWTESITSW